MEKSNNTVPAFILGTALVISFYFLSSGIKEYGKSLERVSSRQPPGVNIPSSYTLRFESGNSPVRIKNE